MENKSLAPATQNNPILLTSISAFDLNRVGYSELIPEISID